MTINLQYKLIKIKSATRIKIRSQKAVEQELCCEFIRIDPGKEELDNLNAINKIVRPMKEWNKKILQIKFSLRLLSLNQTC